MFYYSFKIIPSLKTYLKHAYLHRSIDVKLIHGLWVNSYWLRAHSGSRNNCWIFNALGGEYKAKQNRCCELGVLPSFIVRTFWKYKNPSLDDFEGKKRLDGVSAAWFIVWWFTVVDFHTLQGMFLTLENEAALELFCELGISWQDQFCLEKEINLWRKKKGKLIISKTVRASKLTWQRTLQINNLHLDRSDGWHTSICKKRQKKLSHSRWVDRSKWSSVLLLRKRSYPNLRRVLFIHRC